MSESGKAVIHFINKFKVKKHNPAFRGIMIYQDLDTEFCFIKPLLYKVDMEIIMELLKIFTSYGAPAELHVNSCTQEMVDKIGLHMRVLCPMFNIKFIKKSSDNNDIAMKVVKKLDTWMKETNKDEWEIGCYIVQRQINTEVSATCSLTPHERFFKELGKINCSTEDKEEQNRFKVAEEQHIAKVNSLSETSSKKLLNNSLDTVKVKEEVVDCEKKYSFKDHVVVFEGGLLLPGLKKALSTNVEIKMERLEE